jgi:protein KRI1
MDEEDSESNSAEDENGSLINENLTDKFIETIAKIRMKHPDIYEKD